MDLAAFSQLKEVGIALAVVVGCWWIVRDVQGKSKATSDQVLAQNESVFTRLLARLAEQDINYRAYVESNNHQKTEMIERSVEAMTKMFNAVEAHTRTIERFTEKFLKP